jgi:TonB family protein
MSGLRLWFSGFAITMIVSMPVPAVGQETYRVDPEAMQRNEEHIKEQELDTQWLGYYLMKNHTKSSGYNEMYNRQTLKLPDRIVKIIKTSQKRWDTMKDVHGNLLNPVDLRHQEIMDVNDWVNDHIKYLEFRHGYRTPKQIFTETKKTVDGKDWWFGDCKDLVIAKMTILHQLGFRLEDLNVVAGVFHDSGEDSGTFGHVMLGVRGEKGGSEWVFLDSNQPTLKGESVLREPDTRSDFYFEPLVVVTKSEAYNLIRHSTGDFKYPNEAPTQGESQNWKRDPATNVYKYTLPSRVQSIQRDHWADFSGRQHPYFEYPGGDPTHYDWWNRALNQELGPGPGNPPKSFDIDPVTNRYKLPKTVIHIYPDKLVDATGNSRHYSDYPGGDPTFRTWWPRALSDHQKDVQERTDWGRPNTVDEQTKDLRDKALQEEKQTMPPPKCTGDPYYDDTRCSDPPKQEKVPPNPFLWKDFPQRQHNSLQKLTDPPEPLLERPLYLTVKSDLTLWLGNDPVSRNLLPGILDVAAKGDKDTHVFLRADRTVSYGEMMEVMNLLRAAGYLTVALVGPEQTPVEVNLPPASAQPRPRSDKPLYLSVKADLSLALGNDPVSRELLPTALDGATNGDKNSRIYLRADKAVPYGDVMEVMNLLRSVGYFTVALVGREKVPGPAGLPSGPVQGSPTRHIDAKAMQTWIGEISAALERKKQYPAAAHARREQGTALVSFTIDRQGHVIESRIVRSSGVPDLDDEALALLQRTQPFPPRPTPDINGEPISLTVPIGFVLK